jgi:hypothetical protein
MKIKSSSGHLALLIASASLTGAIQATAANTYYSPGDLVLTFQQEGGSNTVYANLGSAAGFRGSATGPDVPDQLNLINIGTTLTAAFGASWASDTTIYAGLAAVYSTNNTNSIIVEGDAARTLYVSAGRTELGTVGSASSAGYIVNTNTGMTSGATGITAQNNSFGQNYDAQVTISITADSGIDDMNPFLSAGIQGTAMNIFGGGIQQAGTIGSFGTFGAAGSTEFALDLYRIVAKTVENSVPGDVRVGSYEGTFAIGTNGDISFVTGAIPEPSSIALVGLAAGSLVLRRRRSA